MLDLRPALRRALPWLSPQGHAILGALIACEGRIGTAERFAHSAGFRSCHQVARLLDREGLPPIKELSAWIYTLARLLAWEASRISLCRSALWLAEDPGNCYRRVQHLCGVRWSEARAMGFDHMLVRFVQRCGKRTLSLEGSVTKQTA